MAIGILFLCSDQSTIQNVFDFLQDYVPQVGSLVITIFHLLVSRMCMYIPKSK